jgi:hypothetical protein
MAKADLERQLAAALARLRAVGEPPPQHGVADDHAFLNVPPPVPRPVRPSR